MVHHAFGESVMDEMVKKYLKENRSTTYYNGEPGYTRTLDADLTMGPDYRDRGCDVKLMTCGVLQIQDLGHQTMRSMSDCVLLQA
jgi:hypothetical protein